MAKKYLSLEEAASLLGLTVDQVKKAREQNELRGFSDRGSWKFREQDIEEYRRTRESDSSPDMPILSAGDDDGSINLSSSDSDVRLMADDLSFDDDDIKGLVGTGSDVRLQGDSGPKLDAGRGSASKDRKFTDSDSDVRLADADDFGATLEMPVSGLDSDSDVKLFGAADLLANDSDSDVKLAVGPDKTDSDIRLASPSARKGGLGLSPDDSDLKLLNRGSSTRAGQPDSGISLEVRGSGLNLNSDESGISLELDSGISLDADDSGISLESYDGRNTPTDDSGISLDAGDSGISLDLDDVPSPAPADMSRTMPMQSIPAARKSLADIGGTTELQIPTTAVGRSSEFELAGLDDDDSVGTSTSVLTFDDDDAPNARTVAAAALSTSSVEDDVVDDAYGETESDGGDDDYDEESYDEYDADSADIDGDEEGFEVGTTAVSGASAGFARRSDVDWGIPVKAMIGLSAVIGILCSVVGIELMRTMWIWTQPGADVPASAVLDLLGSMF